MLLVGLSSLVKLSRTEVISANYRVMFYLKMEDEE